MAPARACVGLSFRRGSGLDAHRNGHKRLFTTEETVQTTAASAGGTAAVGFEGDMLANVEERDEHGDPLKSLEFIEVGDRVLSRCEKTGALTYKRVTRVVANGFHCIHGVGF